MNEFLLLTLLLRSACDVALIGAFALAHFERGIRMKRSALGFVLYWSVSLVAQILIHQGHFDWGTWWIASAGTLSLLVLTVTLVLDLREHYRTNGYAKPKEHS